MHSAKFKSYTRYFYGGYNPFILENIDREAYNKLIGDADEGDYEADPIQIRFTNKLLDAFVSGAWLTAAGGDLFFRLVGYSPTMYFADPNDVIQIDGISMNLAKEELFVGDFLARLVVMGMDDGRISTLAELEEIHGA